MGEGTISLSGLVAGIQAAFRAWHKPNVSGSPFHQLHLFQQIRLKTGSDQEATRQILLDALNTLDPADATLLHNFFLDEQTMHSIASAHNVSESTAYRRKDALIERLALIMREGEQRARRQWQLDLEKRLDVPPAVPLIGADYHLKQLLPVLTQPRPPWLICIDGLGGLGKTALAGALIRQPHISGRFHNIAWVSAKRQTFVPGLGLTNASAPALKTEPLIDELLTQLGSPIPLTQPLAQKQIALTEHLKQAPTLIVIDNLETIEAYQALFPLLLKLANPSKFLLTSRHSVKSYADVYSLSLDELSQVDTLRFIRQEAEIGGLLELAEAPDEQLQPIYEVAGGHPLALKLIVGQMTLASLDHVLENLTRARGQPITELYTFIYWQAWQMLSPASRQIFLMMPLAHDGTRAQLSYLADCGPDYLDQALQPLLQLSLVQVVGPLAHRRYTLHRLTETFLMNEAIQWTQSS